ncbi:hypothetical protein BDD12DRAFT_820116 [Trichophaea hybrida]|nr:hypothetical protein BDD12DRAFT_820116 [Trichophaea hybrida]
MYISCICIKYSVHLGQQRPTRVLTNVLSLTSSLEPSPSTSTFNLQSSIPPTAAPMFSPHLRTTQPWSTIVPVLQRHPLNLVPAQLRSGADIQLTPKINILLHTTISPSNKSTIAAPSNNNLITTASNNPTTTTTASTTTDTTTTTTDLLTRINRILHSSVPSLTILHLTENSMEAWEIQVKLHENFPSKNVSILPLPTVSDVIVVLEAMLASAKETELKKQMALGALRCMGISEYGT